MRQKAAQKGKPGYQISDLWQPLIKPWEKQPVNQAYLPIFQNPYSFILTVVIPDWPSRFQEKSFKKAIEKELSNECPAHLWLNVLWLDKIKIQQFQGVFGAWWDAYSINEPDAYLYRSDLMKFIMKESFQIKN